MIIIKGKLFDNLEKNLNDLTVSVIYPKLDLSCYINISSNYVQSNIYCYAKDRIDSELLIENQIIYNKDYSESLLLINKLTLYQNYEIVEIGQININSPPLNNYIQKFFYYFKNSYYIIFIIVLLLKYNLRKFL